MSATGEELGAGADPWRIIDVLSLDVETVRRLVAQIEVSSRAEHLVYRESELDALWTLADMALRRGEAGAREWVDLLWEAHDHVGDGEPTKALDALARLLDTLSGGA
jgi:hypothetical protein